MEDTKVITGIVTRFDKVGKQEYALVKPLVANAISMIVTNLPDSVNEGDRIKAKVLQDGNRWFCIGARIEDPLKVEFSDEDEEAPVTVASAAERKAFGEARAKKEALAGRLAPQATPSLAEAAF